MFIKLNTVQLHSAPSQGKIKQNLGGSLNEAALVHSSQPSLK